MSSLRIQLLLLLVALGVMVHAPFLGGGLLTDDFVHISRIQRQESVWAVLTSADSFGFYRPVPQISFLIDAYVHNSNPVLSRVVNLLLHVGVICASFCFARMLLDRTPGAFLATLAFVLTPKAHPIGVLWISARAELFMALFSLLTLRRTWRVAGIAVAVYIVMLGGYQVLRALAIHQDLSFSAKFVNALAQDEIIAQHRGSLLLIPEDSNSERFLRDSIGGYLDIVLRKTFGRDDIGGSVAYAGEPRQASALAVDSVYQNNEVILRSHRAAE